eukprot:1156790-Pelagomonas_calceolata.AAC.2
MVLLTCDCAEIAPMLDSWPHAAAQQREHLQDKAVKPQCAPRRVMLVQLIQLAHSVGPTLLNLY